MAFDTNIFKKPTKVEVTEPVESVEEKVGETAPVSEPTKDEQPQKPVISTGIFSRPKSIVPETPKTATPQENEPKSVVNVESVEEKADDVTDYNGDVINIKGLRQIFNEGQHNEYRLFDGFSLDIPNFENEGQFISIMGASGCGKTCLLRAIAGLTTIPEGDISIYGKSVKEYGHIPMLFQQYSSYEWMTVLDNVALPMILKGMGKEEARERARHLIALVGLTGHEDKYAKTPALSGGQLQRVSIARCLACNSRIMLLDEATSALDVKMKREVQNILLDVYNKSELDPTIINVTHNIEEAIYLSNRIIVLEANPCKVFRTIDVHFTGEDVRKRGPWVLETNEFLEYTKELTKVLDDVCSLKEKK